MQRLREATRNRLRVERGLWEDAGLAFGSDSDGEGEDGGVPSVAGLADRSRSASRSDSRGQRGGEGTGAHGQWDYLNDLRVSPRSDQPKDALMLVTIARVRPVLINWRRKALSRLVRRKMQASLRRVRLMQSVARAVQPMRFGK